MKIIGHRGAAGIEPENTLKAIKRGIEIGVDAVEFDVRMTKDGILILFHDERLERLTNAKGFVRDIDLPSLKKLRVKGEPIPTLDEALKFLKNTDKNFLVELKEVDTIDKVIDTINSHGLRDKAILISFYHQILPRAKEVGFKIGTIFVCRPFKIEDMYKSFIPDYILPRIDMIDLELVEEAHKLGIEVIAWVVNTLEDMSKMKQLKVDWIATDYPDKIIKSFKQSRLLL